MHRVNVVANHVAAAKETLSITDNRTGKVIEVEIKDKTIKALDLKALGLKTYDPGYGGTICCTSKISFIDGDKGILRYRGIPIEQLAEKSNFLETAFLVIYGELPAEKQYKTFRKTIMKNANFHDGLMPFIKAFRADSHPMGMMSTLIACLSSFYPESNPAYVGANIYKDKQERNKHIFRVLGCAPAIAAACYRHRVGKKIIPPNENLGYVENFLYMMDAEQTDLNFRPHPRITRALDILFILHAEHELNCSTAAIRHMASSQSDVYTSLAEAVPQRRLLLWCHLQGSWHPHRNVHDPLHSTKTCRLACSLVRVP